MYTIQYFIDKFKAIPEEQWTRGQLTDANGRHCALGHCGVKNIDRRDETNKEAEALETIYRESFTKTAFLDQCYSVWYINDRNRVKTPKQNVLEWLESLKSS